MSFSSTTSRALSHVSGTFHFPIPALQLTLVLSGTQIQTLLREQGVKQPYPATWAPYLRETARKHVRNGVSPSLILATPFGRPVTFCSHNSLRPFCAERQGAGRLMSTPGTSLSMNHFSKDGLVLCRPYRSRWTRAVMWVAAGKVPWVAPRNIYFFLIPI